MDSSCERSQGYEAAVTRECLGCFDRVNDHVPAGRPWLRSGDLTVLDRSRSSPCSEDPLHVEVGRGMTRTVAHLYLDSASLTALRVIVGQSWAGITGDLAQETPGLTVSSWAEAPADIVTRA